MNEGVVLQRTNDRLFLADYDTPAQAHTAETLLRRDPGGKSKPVDLAKLALARLRLDLLISQQLVVSDTQLLDGALLARVARSGRLRQLVRTQDGRIPIEVRSRADNLMSALWQMYVKEETTKPVVKPFRSSFLTHGAQIQEELRNRRYVPDTRGIPALKKVLLNAGADAAEVDELEAGWRGLLELQDDGLLIVRKWIENFADSFKLSAKVFTLAQLARWRLSEDASPLVAEVRRLGVDRSAVYQFLDGYPHVTAEGHRSDAGLLLDWYNRTYLRAQAFQHMSDFRGLNNLAYEKWSMRDIIEGGKKHGLQLVEIEVPPGILDYLSETSNVSRVYEDQEQAIQDWWLHGNSASLEKVLKHVQQMAGVWSAAPPATSKSVLTFFQSPHFRELTTSTVSGTLGAMAGDSALRGLAAGVVVYFAHSAIESMLTPRKQRISVQDTDYLDAVAPKQAWRT